MFSHAGVSQEWLNDIQYQYHNYVDDIMNCKKGWTEDELSIYVLFIHMIGVVVVKITSKLCLD